VLRCLFTALCMPALRAAICAAAVVLKPLRDAQVSAQAVGVRSPQKASALDNAWKRVSVYLTSEADYRAAMETSLKPIRTAATEDAPVGANLEVTVEERADGTFSVTLPEAGLVPSFAARLDADSAAAAVEEVVERVRGPLLSMTVVWDKWVKPAMELLTKTSIATFDHPFPEDGATFAEYCGDAGALPPT